MLGGLSAHSYNSEVTGELLVAEGGRASDPLWGSDQAARVLKWSNRFGISYNIALVLSCDHQVERGPSCVTPV